jgi:predicted DNA-binding protein
MPGFSDYESPQELKDRLNCLTEKLKNTSRAQVKQEKSG